MCANGLLLISCQFILVKIKLNALFSVKKKPAGAEHNIRKRSSKTISYSRIPWLFFGRHLKWRTHGNEIS